MNKILKMILPLLFVGILLSTTIVRADYNVTVGTTNTYDVIASNWQLKSGVNVGEGTGYPVQGATFDEGTQFIVEVTAENPTSVNWEMSAGTKTETGMNWGMDVLGLIFTLFLPQLLAMGLGSWNQTEIEMGPEIYTLFFVDAPEFSNIFFDLSNETNISESFTDDEWTFTQIGGHFDNSTSVSIFDWVLEARYYSSAVNTDFSGNYYFKYAYDTTTGEMMGYRISFDYAGTINGQLLDIKQEQHVELVGYDLPAFYFKGGFIPGFEWYIAFSAIALIGAATILIVKRKK